MTIYYCSPRTGSAAAATTPARLAQEFERVLWRELPDGGIEVAIGHEDRVERLRVHDDGSTSHLATVALRTGEWAKLLGLFGASVMGTAWVAAIAWGMSTATLDKAMLTLFIAGAALGVVAAVAYWLVADEWRSPLGSGWRIPTNLNGWTPRTSAQLGSVEEIADRHDGRALVRDVGAATIDVCVDNRGSLDHYIVEDDGFTMKQTAQAPPGVARPPNLFLRPSLAVVLFFGLPLIGALIGGVLPVLGLVTGIAAAFWVWHQSPMQKLKRNDGTNWIEIQTQEPDDD